MVRLYKPLNRISVNIKVVYKPKVLKKIFQRQSIVSSAYNLIVSVIKF